MEKLVHPIFVVWVLGYLTPVSYGAPSEIRNIPGGSSNSGGYYGVYADVVRVGVSRNKRGSSSGGNEGYFNGDNDAYSRGGRGGRSAGGNSGGGRDGDGGGDRDGNTGGGNDDYSDGNRDDYSRVGIGGSSDGNSGGGRDGNTGSGIFGEGSSGGNPGQLGVGSGNLLLPLLSPLLG